jgi:outer membrane receptor protein involved in Fe transport
MMATLPSLVAAEEAKPPQKTYYFDIPPGKVTEAVTAWSSITNVPFLSRVVNDRRSPGVKGQFTAEEALRRILRNTGMAYQIDAKGFYVYPQRSDIADPRTGDYRIDEIVVTGTHMQDATVGGPSLISIDMNLERERGVSSFGDLFSKFPQFFGGSTPDTAFRFSPHFGQGVTNATWPTIADLRGLGPGTTLVLINGQRAGLSASDSGRYFDLRTIPFDLVDRVDVLTDGASAIYGSDAIGGVVNIIIKDIGSGGKTQLHLDRQTLGGGEYASVNQRLGTEWSNGSAGLFYEFQKIEPVDALKRPATANLAEYGYPWATLSPRERNHLVFGNARWNFDDGSNLFAELSGSNRNIDGGYGGSGSQPTDVISSATSNLVWAVAGAEIKRDRFTIHINGGLSDSDVSNRVNVFASSAPGEPITSSATHETRFGGVQIDVKPLSWWAGDLGTVLGAEYRTEKISGSRMTRGAVSTDIWAVFGEFRIPVLPQPSEEMGHPSLLLTLADRYDHYSFFGGANSPRFGLEWYPSSQIRLRGSYGWSFRAPLLMQLAGEDSSQLIKDVPASSNTTVRALGVFGPNADLKPERAHSFTTGFDVAFKPLGLTVKATYFNIMYKGQVEPVVDTFDNMLQSPIYAGSVLRRGDIPDPQFDGRLEKFLLGDVGRTIGCNVPQYTMGACTEDPANISALLDFRQQNIAETRTEGFDVLLSGAHELGSGTFRYSLNLSRVLDFKTRTTQNAEAVERVNTAFNPLEQRWRTGIGYDIRDWSFNIFGNYASSYRNEAAQVASMTTLDVSIGYKLVFETHQPSVREFSAVLSGRNVLDKQPPFVQSASGNVSYDPANEDPYGRTIGFNVAYTW